MKEFGSDLTFPDNPQFRNFTSGNETYNKYGQLYFSGRAALYSVLEQGVEQLGWKRIYIPTYNCYDVYNYIKYLDIEMVYYKCNPLKCDCLDKLEDKEGYVLLALDYFGINRLDIPKFKHIFVIEDLTLNFEGVSDSKADVVFGSLRKLLPVPVGGFAKSNNEKFIFSVSNPNLEAEELALQKLSGMYLKSKNLKGEFENKEIFRSLLIEAEGNLEHKYTNCGLPDFVNALLMSLNVVSIIEIKKQNSRLIKTLLEQRDEFALLTSEHDKESACIMLFNNTSDVII